MSTCEWWQDSASEWQGEGECLRAPDLVDCTRNQNYLPGNLRMCPRCGRPITAVPRQGRTAYKDQIVILAMGVGEGDHRPGEAHRSDAEILKELDRAVAKFPAWPTDPHHALNVVAEEFGELSKEIVQLTYEPHKSSLEKVRVEAYQLAAMAIRFARSVDHYKFNLSVQHSQKPVAGGGR